MTITIHSESSASGRASGFCSKCSKTRLFCDCSTSCIVACCQSCTFCLKCGSHKRQSQKKDTSPSSKSKREINSVKGVSFVDHCVFAQNVPSAPNVAHVNPVGGRLPRLLVKMVPPWFKFKGCVHTEGWLHPPIQTQTSTGERPLIISGYANPIRNLYLKEALHELITKKAVERVRVQTSSFLQQDIHCPRTKSEMMCNLGPQCSKQIFERKNIQNGDPGDNSILFTTRGMGDIAGFQRHLFPHTSTLPVPEIPPLSLPKPDIPVPGSCLWPLNSSYGVHLCGKRGQVNGSISGYKDPPVPRRLVDSSPHQRILPPGHPIPPRPLPGVGLDSKPSKIRVGTQTSFLVCGLPIRPFTQTGQTDPEPLGVYSAESVLYSVQSDLSGQKGHVADRPPHSDGKTSASGQTSYETHSVAPQETLEGFRVTGKGDPSSKVSSPTPSNKCLTRSTPTSIASCPSGLYRGLKRGLGCSLRRLHSKRLLVSCT